MVVLGDALSDHAYFDRDPALEFVRHLRNGIGHGNHFNLAKFGSPDDRHTSLVQSGASSATR
jgi:hypothetical protein